MYIFTLEEKSNLQGHDAEGLGGGGYLTYLLFAYRLSDLHLVQTPKISSAPSDFVIVELCQPTLYSADDKLCTEIYLIRFRHIMVALFRC